MRISLCEVSCDNCGLTAYFGEAVKGFVAGKVYCRKCGLNKIRIGFAEKVD